MLSPSVTTCISTAKQPVIPREDGGLHPAILLSCAVQAPNFTILGSMATRCFIEFPCRASLTNTPTVFGGD